MSNAKLFAHPGARRYLIGQSLSLLGDSAMWLACGIWVRTLTGSNAAAGLTFMFFVLPSLLAAQLAGVLVDRVRRRPLLVAANVAGAVVLTPLLLVQTRQDIWIIYTVMFLYGLVNVLIAPAQSALLKVLLPAELLGKANAALRTVQEGLRVLAPLVGAGLFALLGGRTVALLDMATFLAAAGFVAALRVTEVRRTKADKPQSAPEGQPGESPFAEVSAGFAFVAGHAALRRVILATTLAALVIGFGESAGFAVVSNGLHRPPTFIGVLQAAQGVGAIVGGVTAALAMRRVGEIRLAVGGLILFATGTALMSFASLEVVLAGRVCAGAGFPWAIIAIITMLQRLAPDHLQGRVFTAFQVAAGGPQALSIAIGAGLIAVLDYRIVLGTEALVFLAAAVVLSRAREDAPAATEPSAASEAVQSVPALDADRPS
jgi:MFS family permease